MKEKSIFTNTEVIFEIYNELKVKDQWYTKYRGDVSKVSAYDHRDLRPMSYFFIDLSGVPEDQKEQTFKAELEKMVSAFDTLDPKTNKPYPEAIEPYLKRLYTETAGVMDTDIDWNDKKKVERFIHAHLLLQTVQSMTNNFTAEYMSMFPTAEERRKIDAGIVKNQAIFNRADQHFKTHGVPLQDVNQLTLFSVEANNFTRFNEYISTVSADAELSGSNTVLLDPTVDSILGDYFLGNEINSTEFDPVEEEDEPYVTKDAERDIWRALEGMTKSTILESRAYDAFNKNIEQLITIDGKPLCDIVKVKDNSYDESAHLYVSELKKALLNGKSRVEIARFGFDIDGNVNFTYQDLKIDLDKLNTLAGENKFPTNEQRDNELNSVNSLERRAANRRAFESSFVKSLDRNVNVERHTIREFLPEFKMGEDFKRLEKLNSKIESLDAKYRELKQMAEEAEDDFDKHYKKNDASAVRDTMHKLYYSIMARVPADKKDEIHDLLCVEFVAANSPLVLEKSKSSFISNTKDATEEMINYFLFYKCADLHYKNGFYNKVINHVASYLDDKEIDAVIAEVEAYRPNQTNNNPVYYYRHDVNKLKERNETFITDPEKREAINKELDEIANTVITSTREYSVANGDSLDGICDHICSVRDDQILTDALETEQYKHLKDYFDDNPATMYAGVRHINKENVGNLEFPKEITKPEHKFIVPENVKTSLRKIISYMREKGMLQYGGDGRESGSKAYGFMQIGKAMIELRDAMETDDLERIRAARGQYEQALENMRGVFKLIEDELHPTLKNLVGNVNSYREMWLPAEFKNNVVHNALASGIYNLAVALDNGGATLDEMLEDPNATILKMIGNIASKFSPNAWYKDKPLSKGMHAFLNASQKRGYPFGALVRNVELLGQLSVDSPNTVQNTMAMTLLKTYDTYANTLTLTGDRSSVHGYLSTNSYSTLANLFLVNDEDRDYDKLRSYEAISCDGMSHIPAFDTMGYLESHKLDPQIIVDRIKETLTSFDNDKLITDYFAEAIRGAQLAAYEYVTVNPTPDEAFDTKGYEDLKSLITDPKKVLGDIFNEELETAVNELSSMDNYVKRIEAAGKKALDGVRKNERKAEKSFNKQANKLVSSIKKFTKKLEKHPDNDAFKAEKERAERALDELRANELSRLEKAYTDGKIPKNYFEQRTLNIQTSNHDKTVPIGVKEIPSFNEFKKQYAADLKAGDLTGEDVEFFYQRMANTAKAEERKFAFTAYKIHPNPTFIDKTVEEPAADLGENKNDREPIIVEEAGNELEKDKIDKVEMKPPFNSKVKEP